MSRTFDQVRARQGRLLARPGIPTTAGSVGFQQLEPGQERAGMLYVPAAYRPEQPAPLVLMLHGAGGIGRHGISMLRDLADQHGALLLAPDSRGGTWDVIVDEYGPDVTAIQRALEQLFASYAVNPARVAVGGFSDGASYALSLGLGNGDLFTHVLAFSPGFMAPRLKTGKPRIYISHGTQDRVLPIELCSRRIVPRLQDERYEVIYEEFEGPHAVPAAIARRALDWFVAS